MHTAVRNLVEGFAANPMTVGRALRDLANRTGDAFCQTAIEVLRHQGNTPGAHYTLTLLLQKGWLERVITQCQFCTVEEASAIAQAATRIDPGFPVRLAKQVRESAEENSRLLAVLGSIAQGTRMTSVLLPLLRHPDSYVRSKAALLIGRSNQNVRWAENIRDENPRVQANALESLWGASSEEAKELFRTAFDSDVERIGGNALVGSYLAGDPACIPEFFRMAARPETTWRTTGAWAMGEVGDVRFEDVLRDLSASSEKDLRRHAIRSLERIDSVRRRARAAGEIRCRILQATQSSPELLEAIITCGVEGLKPTHFIPSLDGKLVTRYELIEQRMAPSLAFAFLVEEREDLIRQVQEAVAARDFPVPVAIVRCAESKKPAAIKAAIAGQDVSLSVAEKPRTVRFFADAASIAQALHSATTVCPLEAMRSITRAAWPAHTGRHVVTVFRQPPAPGDEWLNAIRKTRSGALSVHRVVPWSGGAADLAAGALQAEGPEDLPSLIQALVRSHLHRYVLRVQQPDAEAAVVRVQIVDERGAGEAEARVAHSTAGVDATG